MRAHFQLSGFRVAPTGQLGAALTPGELAGRPTPPTLAPIPSPGTEYHAPPLPRKCRAAHVGLRTLGHATNGVIVAEFVINHAAHLTYRAAGGRSKVGDAVRSDAGLQKINYL